MSSRERAVRRRVIASGRQMRPRRESTACGRGRGPGEYASRTPRSRMVSRGQHLVAPTIRHAREMTSLGVTQSMDQGLRSSRDMTDFVLTSRRFLPVAALLMAIFCVTSPARAQGIGFQGGATIGPNQGFVGTHFESGELMPGLRFRPGIDGGFGGAYSLAAINIEF